MLVENSATDRRKNLPIPDGQIIVGRIGAPWGLRGDVKMEVSSDIPSRFSSGSVLYLKGKPVRVQRSRSHKGSLLVKLDIADDRNAAEALRDQILTVSEDDVTPLPEGSYYHFQLLDIEVRTEDGTVLGNIGSIISTGSNDVYVIQNRDSKDILVPAIEDVILGVNLEERCMTVRLLDGLI